jgi:hypothetical protein
VLSEVRDRPAQRTASEVQVQEDDLEQRREHLVWRDNIQAATTTVASAPAARRDTPREHTSAKRTRSLTSSRFRLLLPASMDCTKPASTDPAVRGSARITPHTVHT